MGHGSARRVIQESMRLKYEPASEPLHILDLRVGEAPELVHVRPAKGLS